jgi:hypothetical protein
MAFGDPEMIPQSGEITIQMVWGIGPHGCVTLAMAAYIISQDVEIAREFLSLRNSHPEVSAQ